MTAYENEAASMKHNASLSKAKSLAITHQNKYT